jgi:hypothetical protein
LPWPSNPPAPAADADALAKQLSNPVSSLISVPLQLNWDTGYANDGERWLLNVQPVIPITLNEDWNLISRTILPVIHQSDIGGDGRGPEADRGRLDLRRARELPGLGGR